MPHPSEYLPALDKPPFLFAVTGATALPGPALVALMTTLDGSESANKSVLARMVEWGHLDVTRAGRVGVYRLAGTLLDDYEAIATRRRPAPWDGRLHALILDAADVGTVERERFRSAAARHGYRVLHPGLLRHRGRWRCQPEQRCLCHRRWRRPQHRQRLRGDCGRRRLQSGQWQQCGRGWRCLQHQRRLCRGHQRGRFQ